MPCKIKIPEQALGFCGSQCALNTFSESTHLYEHPVTPYTRTPVYTCHAMKPNQIRTTKTTHLDSPDRTDQFPTVRERLTMALPRWTCTGCQDRRNDNCKQMVYGRGDFQKGTQKFCASHHAMYIVRKSMHPYRCGARQDQTFKLQYGMSGWISVVIIKSSVDKKFTI